MGERGALAQDAWGSTLAPILPPLHRRHCPCRGCGRMALVHPAMGISTSLRASPKCDAEVPRSWVSLPTPSHRHGVSSLCVAEGTSAPWRGGDRPRCRGTPAGRRAGCCPQSRALTTQDPSAAGTCRGGPIAPTATQRVAAAPHSSVCTGLAPSRGGCGDSHPRVSPPCPRRAAAGAQQQQQHPQPRRAQHRPGSLKVKRGR